MKYFKYITITALSLMLFAACAKEKEATEEYTEVSYYKMDSNGDLMRPTGYRDWVYVGTPVTPNELNNGAAAFPEFHNVYIDPMSYKHYKKTGKYREGTVMVKELVSVGDKAATSGIGYFQGDFLAVEVTIKSKELYPDEPGNWAYYGFHTDDAGNLPATQKPFGAQHCNICHQTSAAEDWVFSQYYPVLRAAKGVGENVNPEDSDKR
ncbi:MAG: cytochrome P460 family protein [Psychroserpens sp.]|uniref:cytochrome P460 family protein n=1 Tax=Psychroserpens sp. TaxID=2020870 RepID=UPI0030026710